MLTAIVPAGSWLARAIGFFLGPWGRLAAIGVGASFIIWQGRLWMNRHDDKIARETKIVLVHEIQKAQEQQTKERLKELSEIRVTVSGAAQDTQRKIEEMNVKLAKAVFSLKQISEDVKQRRIEYVKEACSIPASDLVPTLIMVSDAIASMP